MKPELHIVPPDAPPKAETVAQRIQRLQSEIKALGRQQVEAMRADVTAGIAAASEVVANPSQPEGISQLAEKIIRDGESLLMTLDQIIGRTA